MRWLRGALVALALAGLSASAGPACSGESTRQVPAKPVKRRTAVKKPKKQPKPKPVVKPQTHAKHPHGHAHPHAAGKHHHHAHPHRT